MFDPFLSCSVFWLPASDPHLYVDIARALSGQERLEPERAGFIHWERRTKVKIGSQQWYTTVGDSSGLDFMSHHALIPLGHLEDAAAGSVNTFAFVSPFSSVAASFKAAAVRYVRREAGPESANVEVDLDAFARDRWSQQAWPIRAVEGLSRDGAMVARIGPMGAAFRGSPDRGGPADLSLRSISFEVCDRSAKVHRDFHIELDDVSTEISRVAACLTEIFRYLREYASVTGASVAAVHA